jgi:transposase-like protein
MPSKYVKRNSSYRTQPHSGKKSPATGTDADLNLVSLQELFADETKAREFLEKKRWANGRVCPHCKCAETYPLTAREGSKSPVRPGVYKCRNKDCRKQFTVRVGTIFEDSKLPIRVWLAAIHLMTAAKNGISSHELSRQLDITQKSGWFVCHRVRESMKREPMAGMLGKESGVVETDETYIGARRRRYTRKGKHGPRSGDKLPVLALVERDGTAVAYPIASPNAETLKGSIRKLVDKSAAIMTDENRCYIGIGKEFDGGHHTTNHSKKEYVRYEQCGPVFVSTTNTVESFFSRLKRSFVGTYHKMSAQHLEKYVTEFAFRWNTRKAADGVRMVEAIKGAEGRRLMYREPTGGLEKPGPVDTVE